VNTLLIEDNQAMQIALSRALTRKGMRVSVCSDGALALDMWQTSLPDIVLLDLSLPHLDGLQVLSQARQAGLKTPVLILTARGTVGDKVLGLNAGADDYLPKPFDLDELEARMRAPWCEPQGAGQTTCTPTKATGMHHVKGKLGCCDSIWKAVSFI
jgi:two-component system, OmpR family, response regulator TctD